MAVNVPNSGVFLADVGSVITSLRDAYQACLNKNNYLTAMGGIAFLQAPPFNLSPSDAQGVVAALGNIAASNVATALTNSETMWGGN